MLCLWQPTANYDLAIIEDYLAGNAKIKIDKKQNGVVVIFGEPWQLLLTGSAVPRNSQIGPPIIDFLRYFPLLIGYYGTVFYPVGYSTVQYRHLVTAENRFSKNTFSLKFYRFVY